MNKVYIARIDPTQYTQDEFRQAALENMEYAFMCESYPLESFCDGERHVTFRVPHQTFNGNLVEDCCALIFKTGNDDYTLIYPRVIINDYTTDMDNPNEVLLKFRGFQASFKRTLFIPQTPDDWDKWDEDMRKITEELATAAKRAFLKQLINKSSAFKIEKE